MNSTSSRNDNELTLQSYQHRTDEYVTGTPPLDDITKSWIDQALSYLSADGTILEIGSGFGRDAEYIREKGFLLECSDAVPNFVSILKEKGFSARNLNVLKDVIQAGYNLIIADAVLIHFTPEECAKVIDKIRTALQKGGIFALRMKKGSGPVWSDEKLGAPRYFYYWQEEDLIKLLTDHGFKCLDTKESYTSHNDTNWMHLVAIKN